jgi:hypothetical protein
VLLLLLLYFIGNAVQFYPCVMCSIACIVYMYARAVKTVCIFCSVPYLYPGSGKLGAPELLASTEPGEISLELYVAQASCDYT